MTEATGSAADGSKYSKPLFTAPSTGDIFLCPPFFEALHPSLRYFKEDFSRIAEVHRFRNVLHGDISMKGDELTSLDEISATPEGSMSSLLFQELFHQTGFNTEHYIHWGLHGGSKLRALASVSKGINLGF